MEVSTDKSPKSFGDTNAIPTRYAGIRFRSRIEARFAYMLDRLGVGWLYEHEARGMKCGPYLVDFLLPELDTWVEMKGAAPTPIEKQRCVELCEATAQRVLLLYGPFGAWLGDDHSARWASAPLAFLPTLDPFGDVQCIQGESFWPCLCPVCAKFDFQYQGRGARVCKGKTNCCGDLDDRSCTFNDYRIVSAINDANTKSFWK